MLSKVLSNGKNFFSCSPSVAQIQAVKSSAFVVFELKTDGALSVELSNGQKFAWNVQTMKADLLETLIHACLNDQTVIGRDLTFAYAWCYSLSPSWMPSCTLDVSAMARVFEYDEALIAAEPDALAGLYAIAGVHDYSEAVEAITMLDERFGGSYFGASELVPYGLRKIILYAMLDMIDRDGGELDFQAYISQEDSGYYVLHSIDNEAQLMFDEPYFSIMSDEIDIALDQAIEKIWVFASK